MARPQQCRDEDKSEAMRARDMLAVRLSLHS